MLTGLGAIKPSDSWYCSIPFSDSFIDECRIPSVTEIQRSGDADVRWICEQVVAKHPEIDLRSCIEQGVPYAPGRTMGGTQRLEDEIKANLTEQQICESQAVADNPLMTSFVPASWMCGGTGWVLPAALAAGALILLLTLRRD